MSFSEDVKLKNGGTKHVVADSEADLKEAVKLAGSEEAPVYPNINRPVQKGHDLVATGSDLSKVLVDGEGAHNSPYNAIDDDGKETGDPKVEASGLDEPAYKSVPQQGSQDDEPRVASDSEVKKAKSDAESASDVQEQQHKTTAEKGSKTGSNKK